MPYQDVPQSPLVGAQTQQAFFNWLFGYLTPNGAGGLSPAGANPYLDELNVNPNTTLMPDIDAMFRAGNPGTTYIQSILGDLVNPRGWTDQYRGNVESTGGIGGMPTDLMGQLALYGTVNGPGTNALNNILSYGQPSQATGYGMMNMLGYGVAHPTAGAPLAQLAQGQGPVAQILAPYMARNAPYVGPSGPGGQPPPNGGR